MTAIDSNAPTATKLEEAIAQLGRYYGIVSSSEFMAKLLGFSAATYEPTTDPIRGTTTMQASASADIIQNAATDATDPVSFLANGLNGLTDGGTLISEFNDIVSEFLAGAAADTAIKAAIEGGSGTGDRLFTVTHEKDPSNKFVCTDFSITDLLPQHTAAVLNQNTKAPSKFQPSLGVVQFHSAALNFANRYSGAVAVFMSALPTIEISRCVPYLDVQLISNQPSVDSEGNIGDGISLFRFLNGNSKVDSEWVEWMNGKPMDESPPTLFGTQEEMLEKTVAGMELFTAPQTLNNGDEPYYDIGPPGTTEAGSLVRATSVIDKFRPFMTLQSFNIKVMPSTGTLSTKTADCQFILHDRSRLHEISQLVTPGGLIDVDIQVEYGWSHPDENSPYGVLLNAMRSKEKFGVMNSSYSFDPNGEVKVTLKLYSKGSRDTSYSLITDSEVENAMDSLRDAVRAVGDMRRKMKSMGFGSLAEIVDGGDVLGKANSVSSILALNAEDLKKLKEAISKIAAQGKKDGGVMKELGDALTTAVNGQGGSGGLQSYKDAVKKATAAQLTVIADGNDPFLKNCKSSPYINVERDRTPPNVKHVSFAKIATNFIGGPIAATGKFTEVQMIFYPLNEYASFARDNDTGSFPIELGYFKKAILEKMQESPTFTVGQFIGFMNRNFFANGAADAFGFGDIFTRDEKNGKAVLLASKIKNEKAKKQMKLKLPKLKEAALKAAYRDPAAAARFKFLIVLFACYRSNINIILVFIKIYKFIFFFWFFFFLFFYSLDSLDHMVPACPCHHPGQFLKVFAVLPARQKPQRSFHLTHKQGATS